MSLQRCDGKYPRYRGNSLVTFFKKQWTTITNILMMAVNSNHDPWTSASKEYNGLVKMKEFQKVTFTFLRYSFGSKWLLKRCKEDVMWYRSHKNYQRENDIISAWKDIIEIFSLKILIAVLLLEIRNQRVWVKLKGRWGTRNWLKKIMIYWF